MNLIVESTSVSAGTLICGPHAFRCALGRRGTRIDKREGDGATPIGTFALRRLFYRSDRMNPPAGGFRAEAIEPSFGWCDDPLRPEYNQFVRLPYTGRHENLWRADALYDLVVVIGYNDAPVVPALGSAIFLHVAAPGYAPTEGCIALALGDLMMILATCDAESTIHIAGERES